MWQYARPPILLDKTVCQAGFRAGCGTVTIVCESGVSMVKPSPRRIVCLCLCARVCLCREDSFCSDPNKPSRHWTRMTETVVSHAPSSKQRPGKESCFTGG